MFALSAALHRLTARGHLSAAEARFAVVAILDGEWGEADAAAFLVALRMKGETAEELAAAAGVLRERMVRFDTGRGGVLDTCGTGGDGAGTFNISTAAALVAAGAGVPVVKHGNRAFSSPSGSADVLAELGVSLGGPAEARAALDRAGLAFCFAPHFHPVMAKVSAVRRRLGVRTVFNLLGPLANPAGADYQLLGVGRPELLDPLAGAVRALGTRQAILVCGASGLDEVDPAGVTHWRRVRGGEITAGTWTAADFGLAACDASAWQATGAAESAAIIRRVLAGEPGLCRDVVVANAAAALLAAEAAGDLAEGVRLAQRAIDEGAARRVLERLSS